MLPDRFLNREITFIHLRLENRGNKYERWVGYACVQEEKTIGQGKIKQVRLIGAKNQIDCLTDVDHQPAFRISGIAT